MKSNGQSPALSPELVKLASPCFSCGTCSAACPWTQFRSTVSPIRKIIRQVQLGRVPENEDVWLCTTCKSCEASCPRGVSLTQIMAGLRQISWRKNRQPKGMAPVAWSVFFAGNPWQRAPSERMLWAKNLKLKSFEPTDDILLYFGCNVSYDKRIQKVARAVAALLQTAGVRFGVLGDKEPCCGEAINSLGHAAYAAEIVEAAGKTLDGFGVKNMVAISPHCFDMFKNHYPRFRTDNKVIHYTEFLADLIDQKKISWKEEVPFAVTYHDPCYLGRSNGQYEAPRRILRSITGLDLREMPNNRTMALCCGGGGGRMFMETPSDERFANLRMREASATGADFVATACPFCISCLEDSAKLLGLPIQVLDVAEIAAHAALPEQFPLKPVGITEEEEEEIEAFYEKGQTSG